MDILAIRVTLADGSFVDCSTAILLYLKLCGDLQSYSSELSKMVYVACHILCIILLNLTNDMVLGMALLHAINPQIDWNAYSLFWTVEVTLYVFWVCKVVLVLMLRSTH